MEEAPVNVKVKTPKDFGPGWADQEALWLEVDREALGHPDFYPLTVKAAYVIGVTHDICESVQILLSHRGPREVTFIPAYAVFSAGVELLGRCVNGNKKSTGSVKDLKTGFKWLVSSQPDTVSDTQEIVKTSAASYSVDALVALRHFAAHGQGNSNSLPSLDFELLAPMPAKIADGLERYWNALNSSDLLCERLAVANIRAFRHWPVFKSWVLFQGNASTGHQTITNIFNRFKWQAVAGTSAA
jgi:hypothetical protein